MTIIHPSFLRRLAEVYLAKWDNEGRSAATEWAKRTVPQSEIQEVRKHIRRIRAEQDA
jgi:hypothetical protein